MRLLVTLLLLALTGHSYAMTGSNAFICDVIRYSIDLVEVKEAEAEATSRGICGFAKPPKPEPVKKRRNYLTDPPEQAENIFLMALMIWGISSGTIDGTVTIQSSQAGSRISPR